jgi:hypothetical protein
MLGWTEYLIDRIQALRIKELVDYADYRKFATYRNVFGTVPDTLAPPLTLMVRDSHSFPAEAYHTNSIFSDVHPDARWPLPGPNSRIHDSSFSDALDRTGG